MGVIEKIKNEIPVIDNTQSYWEALESFHSRTSRKAHTYGLLHEFIKAYQLDTKLHITFNDVQNDLAKIEFMKELTNKIPVINDKQTYLKVLELLYDEYKNDMFSEKMIQEFINVYHTKMCFSDVWNDLAKIKFKDKIGVITDKQTYWECLEIYYNEFEDDMFNEEIISKFVNAHHLNTKFHITTDKVWEDLAKIKRVSKLEDKLIDEIGSVENIESYKEALELYYNVLGEDMFEIEKVQKFIDTFKLHNIDITPNMVYRDLRTIKHAFGSNDEISQSNFSSLHPDIKPVVTTTPPVKTGKNQTVSAKPTVQTQSIQSQTVNTTPPVQGQSEQNQNASNTLAEHNESFYSYVTHMSNTQLINTIDGQYKSIKGTWAVAPCMGEYGSIEFSAVLLLWRYAMANFDRNQESFASLQITLGNIIGCSFFGMPTGEWSDKVDPILNSHADILTYDEFGDVYNYLKDRLMDKIHSLEFNRGNMKDAESRQLYARFTQIYNSMSGYPEVFNFYTSKGLNLEKDIQSLDESATASLISQKWEWGDKDFMKAVFAFLTSQKWESCFRDFAEDADINMPPTLTDKFYISSYRCPTCGRHMYKTVFPIGAESPIKIDNEVVLMKRIFTCPTCQTFYTPLSGHKLSHGQCYCLESRTYYDLLLKIFDSQGTIDGRPDA